jgi:hypothetical protein
VGEGAGAAEAFGAARVGNGEEAAGGDDEAAERPGEDRSGEGVAGGAATGSPAVAVGEGLCARNWRSAASVDGAVVEVALPYPKATTAAMMAARTPKADATKGCAEIQRMRVPPVLGLWSEAASPEPPFYPGPAVSPRRKLRNSTVPEDGGSSQVRVPEDGRATA